MQTGQADIAQLSYEFLDIGAQEGTFPSLSTQLAFELVCFFPGLFREDSDLFQPDNPFEDPRVREAFARAIDLEEINNALFSGIGTSAHILSCHPTDRCFDTQFEDDFTAAYTYDPERAKQLLAEAGYPNGFPFGMAIFEAGTFADLGIVTEFIAAMAFDVGFQPEFIGAEYSEIRPAMVDKTLNLMFGLALINRPMTEAVEIFNYSETVGPGSGAERVYLDEL